MERMLLVKIASRGDLLLAAPTFRHLRQSHPQAHITLLVGATCEDVARHLPYFDQILVFDDRSLFASSRLRQLRAAGRFLRELRAWRGRAAVGAGAAEVLIFHRDWRYGLLAWLAGIRVRRGFASRLSSRFLTHAYQAGAREHHAEQYLGMALQGRRASPGRARGSGEVAGSLAGTWRFEEGERELALALASTYGFAPEEGEWVALGFGGGRNVKTRTHLKSWPIEHYRELALALAERGWRVVWLGDREDARVLGQPPVGVNLAGMLTVPESAAVLSACSLAVVNDTLLLHLASALGLPTLGLFGPTDPEHYRPRGEQGRYLWLGPEAVPCSPCHRDGYFPPCRLAHRCMRALTVEAVLDTVRELSPSAPKGTEA